MKYIERSPELQFVLLENVKGMFSVRKSFGNERPLAIQSGRMAKLGFDCAFASLVNSCDYGLAQSRTRAWALYVRRSVRKP